MKQASNQQKLEQLTHTDFLIENYQCQIQQKENSSRIIVELSKTLQNQGK
jgi:hypothetical protein